MNIQIGDYEVNSFILDIGLDINILTKKTWENMGQPTLGWSPVQLRLDNQAKVQPIGWVSNLVVDVEGMRTHTNFNVIEVFNGEGSYPALLGVGWANDSMAVINFKKWMMTFENQDIRVIAPMDPDEGRRYIEPVKDEVFKEWDHSYNIFEEYIHPTADGELSWRYVSYVSSDSKDALENWQNRMHEVSFRKCGLITHSLRHVTTEIVELPVYEGLPELSAFLMEFEDKVLQP